MQLRREEDHPEEQNQEVDSLGLASHYAGFPLFQTPPIVHPQDQIGGRRVDSVADRLGAPRVPSGRA